LIVRDGFSRQLLALDQKVAHAGLRAATSMWRTRTALIDGNSEEQTHRRWTFEESLTESEKVARGTAAPFRFRRTHCDLGGQLPALGDD
jgi:hypothetical protein